MSLFEEQQGKIHISPEYKLIPEFAKLLKRDKSKDKSTALKELAYIYFMTDFKSPYVKYPEGTKALKVRKDMGFDAEWKVDNAVQAAMDKYDELISSETLESLRSARKALVTSNNVINVLRETIEEDLENIKRIRKAVKNVQDREEKGEEVQSDSSDMMLAVTNAINTAVQNLEYIMKTSTKIPDVVNKVKQLEDQVKKEASSETKIKGGGEVGAFEE